MITSMMTLLLAFTLVEFYLEKGVIYCFLLYFFLISSYSQKEKKGKMKYIKCGVTKATSIWASKVKCDWNAYDAIA